MAQGLRETQALLPGKIPLSEAAPTVPTSPAAQGSTRSSPCSVGMRMELAHLEDGGLAPDDCRWTALFKQAPICNS